MRVSLIGCAGFTGGFDHRLLEYQLQKLDGTVAALGHKQAFCLEDLLKYSNDFKSSGYTCASRAFTCRIPGTR